MLLTFEAVMGMVQGAKALIDSVRAGRVRVHASDGRELTKDELDAKFAAFDAAQAQTSHDVAARIDQRHE